jgi:hypothetical protein
LSSTDIPELIRDRLSSASDSWRFAENQLSNLINKFNNITLHETFSIFHGKICTTSEITTTTAALYIVGLNVFQTRRNIFCFKTALGYS